MNFVLKLIVMVVHFMVLVYVQMQNLYQLLHINGCIMKIHMVIYIFYIMMVIIMVVVKQIVQNVVLWKN